jgi:putative hemolysin
MILIKNKRTSRTNRRPYLARLARSAHDVQRAQRLRFEVFNLELGEGLAKSYVTGLDADPFDECCDHLIVEETTSGAVVGTYRLQTGQLAAANRGYYSEREFDFMPYESLRCELIELGRACVHKDHRNFNLLHLLWRGIARYALERKARYLVGCSSLTSQDPAAGSAMYESLQAKYLVRPELQTNPRTEFALPLVAPAEGRKAPKLLRAYLSIGAKICGPPAIDREFGTIDFLTLLDLNALPLMVRAHFFGELS